MKANRLTRDILKRRARHLLQRLERISADSSYAHQASGYRGALLRALEHTVLVTDSTSMDEIDRMDWEYFEQLVDKGFEILVLAAEEIPQS